VTFAERRDRNENGTSPAAVVARRGTGFHSYRRNVRRSDDVSVLTHTKRRNAMRSDFVLGCILFIVFLLFILIAF
jgi:hypothetical protein